MSTRRPLQPLEPHSSTVLNTQSQRAMPPRDDEGTQESQMTGLTALENDTDDFGKYLVQQKRDEQRRQNALSGNARLQPFRKARKDASFALTYTNLARAEKESSQSPTIIAQNTWSPQQSESGSDTANLQRPRPRPPRTWGRNGRVKRGWMRDIVDAEAPQKESGDQNEDITHRSLGSDSTDWSGQADLPLESVEPTSHSSPATPGDFRRGSTYESLVTKQRSTEKRITALADDDRRVSFDGISPPAESPGGRRLEAAYEKMRDSLERRSRSRSISQDDIAADFTATSLVTSTPAMVSRNTRLDQIAVLEAGDIPESRHRSETPTEASGSARARRDSSARGRAPASKPQPPSAPEATQATTTRRPLIEPQRASDVAKERSRTRSEQPPSNAQNKREVEVDRPHERNADSQVNLRALSRVLSSKSPTPSTGSERVAQLTLPSPPSSPLQQPVKPKNLPKSALSAVIRRSKNHLDSVNAIGDSTIDSLEDLLPSGEETSTSHDEDTLAGLRLPAEEPRNEGERQRQREVRQLVTMSTRLSATRANLRDAGKGLRRVEHQMDMSDGSDASSKIAQASGVCNHSTPDVLVLNPFQLVYNWILSKLFKELGTGRRLTVFGMGLTVLTSWILLEQILCFMYCKPEYADSMVGFGVDPYAPERPFVVPTMLARLLGMTESS